MALKNFFLSIFRHFELGWKNRVNWGRPPYKRTFVKIWYGIPREKIDFWGPNFGFFGFFGGFWTLFLPILSAYNGRQKIGNWQKLEIPETPIFGCHGSDFGSKTGRFLGHFWGRFWGRKSRGSCHCLRSHKNRAETMAFRAHDGAKK